MGRNEIRLRRQRMTARGIDRFRNYNSVLQRHEQTQRLKKIIKVFGYFVVLLIVIMLIIFFSRWEQRLERKNQPLNHMNASEMILLAGKNQSNMATLPDYRNPSYSHRGL